MRERTRIPRRGRSETTAPDAISRTSAVPDGVELPADIRPALEDALGHSIARIRIHADAEGDSVAESYHAKGVTIGDHIYFKDGAFAPRSAEGLRLLSHEAAHVAQQENALGEAAVAEHD